MPWFPGSRVYVASQAWLDATQPGDSLDAGELVRHARHAPDDMRLSITRSPDSAVDFVQIRGDVNLSNSGELGLVAAGPRARRLKWRSVRKGLGTVSA
jgi:hypothetical protein